MKRALAFAALAAALAVVVPASAQDAPASFTPTTFELVQANGRAVLVGTAEPGATIELLEGGVVIARATANERGEWIVAPDGLAPGTHIFAIRTVSADGRYHIMAAEGITIAVAEARTPGASAGPAGQAFTIADFAVTIDVSAGAGATAEGAVGYPRLAVVLPGDSPWRLAERYYGTGTLYQLILDANRDAIRRAGTLLPGMTLLIPDPTGH